MPFMFMPPKAGKLPRDLKTVATKSNEKVGKGLAEAIPVPDEPFDRRVYTGFAKALAGVLKRMGLKVEVSSYDKDIREVGPDEARALAMVSAAARDYGEPLPVAMEDLDGDTAMATLAGALTALAGDRDFQDWLKEDEEEEEVEEVEEEEDVDDTADFNFAGRL